MNEIMMIRKGGTPKAAINLAEAEVTLDFENVTFDGSKHKPTVTAVILAGQPLTENVDYMCINNAETDAGTYTIQVLGILNYGGVVEKNWNIEKAEANLEVSSQSITVKGIMGTVDESIVVTKHELCKVSAVGDEFVDAEVTEDNKLKLTSVKAGEGHVTVKVADGNFVNAEVIVDVAVEKADASISVEPSSITITGVMGTKGTVTLNYTGDGEITIENNTYCTIEREGKTLNITSVEEGTDNVLISIGETENYTGASCELEVIVKFIDSILENNSWEAIASAAASGIASTTWQVGDKKTIELNGKTYHAQIIGFDHDDLDSTDAKYSDASYNSNKKKAAITFQMDELFDTYYKMNNSNTNNGGWKSSIMRTSTMPIIKGYMPQEVKNNLRTVSKASIKGSQSTITEKTADDVFLPAIVEVFPGSYSTSSGYKDEGTGYAYWIANDNNNARIKKKLDGTAYYWWLRSPNVNNSTYFRYVYSDGSYATDGASNSIGVAACFCL